jgi:mono/diheme cytochrome c family protein
MKPVSALAPAILPCLLLMACMANGAAQAQSLNKRPDGASIERGRYLARTAGCNDCHTPNYPQSGGTVPEKQWLIGEQLGWRGPWGTTYPTNLRKYMQEISEEEWVKIAQTKQMRPPMPWFGLRDMTQDDLRSLYRFIRHLGPDMNKVPDYVAPGQMPKGPFVQFPAPLK